MEIILLVICGILHLCSVAFLVWLVWTFFTDRSKIKNIFKKVINYTKTEESRTHKQDEHKTHKQEEYKPSQEEIVRSIIRDEMERMGTKIIRSIPKPINISQSEIVNEIRYNRQLLERLMVSLEKRQEKEFSEPVKPASKCYPIVKFSRMVDNSSPLGFKMTSLSDNSKGACYQIVINSETQASYRLITDLTIQREIIAMFNPIITSGCEYDEEPTVINEIVHIADGLLELHSGVWYIVKKAKIRFI